VAGAIMIFKLLNHPIMIFDSSQSQPRKLRQKACKACAQSKRKCDMQVPCFRCKTQGKECVPPEVEKEPELYKIESEPDTDLVLLSRPYSESFPTSSWNEDTSSAGSSTIAVSPPGSPSDKMDISSDPRLIPYSPAAFEDFSSAQPESWISLNANFDMEESRTLLISITSYSTLTTSTIQVDLFLQHFTANLPIFHTATWRREKETQHPLLNILMQAYGATYLDTPEAQNFAYSVINSEFVPGLLTMSLVRLFGLNLSIHSF